MNRTLRAFAIVLLGAAAGCGEGTEPGPQAEWPEWSTPAASIGALETPPTQAFGSIDDVALGSDGTIVVLDGQAARVSVFDSTGQFQTSFGGAGDGPSELQNPLSIALTADRRVVVGQLRRSWKAFLMDRIGLEDPQTAQLTISPRDMCMLSSGIATHGVIDDEDALVWVYSPSGEPRGSFGVQTLDPVMRTGTFGRIACSPQDMLVYAAEAVDSIIRAYAPGGQPAWTSTISGYLTPIVTVTDTSLEMRMPETGWHTVASLLPWSPDAFIVQVAFHTVESREREARWASLETYVIDAASGIMARDPADIPELIAANDRFVVGVSEDPFPRLTVWRR